MSYVTMPNIGDIGNLGSQIQQYFSMEAIATVNKKTLVFPEFAETMKHGLKFAKLLNLTINIIPNIEIMYFNRAEANTQIDLDERVFKLEDNINYGFTNRFDLYHYWYKHIKEKVFNTTFRSNILQQATDILNNIQNTETTISLHVRRGDYLLPQHSHFVKLDTSYYEMALHSLNIDKKNCQIMVFSDDMSWCKNNLCKLHNNIHYIENNIDFVDICLMSLCKHNIIANSSFSWWAAYFNKNQDKKIVCPKKYLIDQHPLSNVINQNYYPDTWLPIG